MAPMDQGTRDNPWNFVDEQKPAAENIRMHAK